MTYRSISLLLALLVSVLVLMYVPSGTKSSGPSVSINIPLGARLKEVSPNEPPALYQLISECDYVVIASTTGKKAVRKRGGNPNDLADLLAGTLDFLQVEEVLYSRETEPTGPIYATRSFDMLRLNDVNATLSDRTRYLLFLSKIPVHDKVFENLELDKEKTYYRTVIGTQSIFPEPGNRMHGSFKVGRINLSSGQYPKLVETIRRLTEALNEKDEKEKVKKLRELTKSDDEVLRQNAEYATNLLVKKP